MKNFPKSVQIGPQPNAAERKKDDEGRSGLPLLYKKGSDKPIQRHKQKGLTEQGLKVGQRIKQRL